MLAVHQDALRTQAFVLQPAMAEGCASPAAGEAWEDGRHLRAAQRGPRLMKGQCPADGEPASIEKSSAGCQERASILVLG